MQVTATKIFEFSYSHRLPSYDGKCASLHGHTGRVEITVGEVKGPGYPGITADFAEIKKRLSPIIDEVDHKHLNDIINSALYRIWAENNLSPVVDENGNRVYVPTSENMIRWFRMRILQEWREAVVVRIRFWESPSSYCEWAV
ncbi:MAG: 6-pyruvoyltetrahydropterin/6-carboxytetrahydropterin synthase [Candidatus Desulfovibrio kirbyi]|jgi:6-pyruvoyltetrahydropterin/6-carboxytetrahydropterin synthase|uniref:6-carboxy-5,6,7,8-tetrahydropterin synthase n=1 Tax=Candidatus Desulfovibrio kirbyi TaxID=2696086 RepID=A0A6L2R4B9_9BACT|nr:6-carboxytetrahydropterin synthase [Desulfovibrio sp.]GFH62304.1 MAG: 6-pyruvoyltetrahydropterin/6-carboxytetrahydropterin synthase [Candidatus Desulfovibrio kirbyi]